MLSTFRKYWQDQPLTVVLVLAVLFRMLAVLFSKGYGMHDDHFLIIEVANPGPIIITSTTGCPIAVGVEALVDIVYFIPDCITFFSKECTKSESSTLK